LIEPYMPPLQCPTRPQKNQIGLSVWVTFNVNTPTLFEALLNGTKPELNPFCWRAVLNCHAHGLAKLLWVTVWLPPRNSKLMLSPVFAVICWGSNTRPVAPTVTVMLTAETREGTKAAIRANAEGAENFMVLNELETDGTTEEG